MVTDSSSRIHRFTNPFIRALFSSGTKIALRLFSLVSTGHELPWYPLQLPSLNFWEFETHLTNSFTLDSCWLLRIRLGCKIFGHPFWEDPAARTWCFSPTLICESGHRWLSDRLFSLMIWAMKLRYCSSKRAQSLIYKKALIWGQSRAPAAHGQSETYYLYWVSWESSLIAAYLGDWPVFICLWYSGCLGGGGLWGTCHYPDTQYTFWSWTLLRFA